MRESFDLIRRSIKGVSLSALFILAAMPSFAGANYQYVDTECYWCPDKSFEWENRSANDGAVQPTDLKTISVGSSLDLWTQPQKGWAVDHWRKSSSFFSSLYNMGKRIEGSEGRTNIVWTAEAAGNVHIAVKFGYLKYDLVYDGNGGGTPAAPSGVVYTNEVTLATAPSAPSGYSFAGWKATGGSTTYAAGDSVSGASFHQLDDVHTDGSVITLVAQWTPNAYRLDCQPNGGSWTNSFAPPSSATYDTVFSLPPPALTGYDFLGWKVTGNLDTATARWGKTNNPTDSLNAETVCANGAGQVYFKNLNPTNDATVALAAQWKASTVLVTFNNMGASSGEKNLSVTYDAAYIAVNTPIKQGSAFKGYMIDGKSYWDKNGQPTKSVWDITTNCTAIAQWDEIPYAIIYDENRTDGKSSKSEIVPFAYGEAITLSDGTFQGGTVRFENFGCTLLGWSINRQASTPDDGCGLGMVKTFYESKNLYAVWEKNFFIAYDGNGATEGEMAVQKLVVDKSGQILNANAYAKTGYGFLGWATNRAAAAAGDWKYADHAVLPQDYAVVLGQTNTLSATWNANTYYVAFDPNGGTGAPMTAQTCKYDQPVILSACTYANGAYDFFGWSNDVEKVIYTDLSKPVSNLCTTANGTNTLYAVWKLSDLSAAMECTNLRWENVPFSAGKDTDEKWQVGRDGSNTWSCAQQEPATASYPQTMTSSVITNSGTLTFYWMPDGNDGDLIFWIDEFGGELPESRPDYPRKKDVPHMTGTDGVWVKVTTNLVINAGERKYIHLANDDFTSTISVDLMTWTPDSVYPVPEAKDAATISSAAVVDGRFILSFAATNVFDYVLRTNADLRADSWGMMTRTNGAATVTFEPPILPGLPQLFYKVETVQKK